MTDTPIVQDANTPRLPLRFSDIDDLVSTELLRIESTPWPNKGAKIEAQVALLFQGFNEAMYTLRCMQGDKRIHVPS